MERDLSKLVEGVMDAYMTEAFSVEFDDLPLAMLSGNEFELEPTAFTITAQDEEVIATRTGEGTITENTMLLEYKFSIDDSQNPIFIFISNKDVEFQK